MSGRLRIPLATYRLQLNKDFRFNDARSLVSYLSRLGISDIYASPIFKTRKGSSHGYDVTDPTTLNPELGTGQNFNNLVKELGQQGMGLLLDIVPNHMAASPENPWWQDVLEHGKKSPFAGFFDIDWLNFGGSSQQSTGYRKFFDLGDFVCVRVEDPKVFEATHSYILRLIAEGKVNGLRIDHIDGLYDPREYLLRLQRQITGRENREPGFYVLVEKILSGDETIPQEWPVFGSTGYDFAGILNTLFLDSAGIEFIREIYARATGPGKDFSDLVYEKKKQVMLELFSGEMAALGQWLAYLSGQVTGQAASAALIEVTACLPVYRTYINSLEIAPRDRRYLETAVRAAVSHRTAPAPALRFLKMVLLQDFTADATPQQKNGWLNFVRRWQQLTDAIMAKGFEDTALYNYHCLVSLNEVGGEPDSSGLPIEEFHKWNETRVKHWPHTLNATSTHDTKRSEDVRARISVLSEIPGEWEEHLIRWQQWNHRKKASPELPETNTEILLYQTLIGAWPLHRGEVAEFRERLKAYMIKTAREAKSITSWLKIDREYEDSILGFIDAILEDSADNEFLNDFLSFQTKTAWYGALNSISQLLLKITAPGVPDFYQGTELWDFSLVDPDNRRPVDFQKRKRLLDSLPQKEADGKPLPVDDMLASWQDGRIKLYLTCKALNTRRDHGELFQKGEYLPLAVAGRREHVCAFARRYGDKWALIGVPRFFTRLSEAGIFPIGQQVWQEDHILLPENSPRDWLNVFTGETVSGVKEIALSRLFDRLPVALLVGR